MPAAYFKNTNAFTSRKKKTHISVQVIKEGKADEWLKKQDQALQEQAKVQGFKTILATESVVYAKISDKVKLFDGAVICDAIGKYFSDEALKTTSFEIKGASGSDLEKLHIGWGWACYRFERYKAKSSTSPLLLWGKDVNKKSVQSHVESVDGLRDLVNTPANDLGPEELEKAVKSLAKEHKATVKIVKDKALLDKNFPLIYTVGMASPRAPRLIEMNWGNTKHPKLTLVGKGVVFDTGGLDIKPSAYMKLMKKDMGGAAHVIALTKLIMDHKLPVRLKLLIPAVENAVGGASYRPGDIMKSRKGLFVENTNTDAEGRLVLADALTYACEGKPELLIDFATLTGSARAGLGPDIPAYFCNDDKVYPKIQKLSQNEEDPVWPMPLHQPYRQYIENSTGDLINSAGVPGDGIYSALFLESFVEKEIEWMHLDCFSWENTGRPGRPKGAADTGLRAIFRYLQERYG